MTRYFVAYLFTVVTFLAIDFVWLTQVARGFYFGRLGDLLLESPRLGVAAAFYALFVVGLVYFAVAPALRDGSVMTALISGALFGFFAYATYDLTNYSTLKNWPLAVSLVDMAWGTVLCGVSATVGFLATRAVTSG